MTAEFDLGGRVTLVTGGGRGLGRGMAVGLARAGARVVVSSRTERELRETVTATAELAGEAVAVPWDLGEPTAAAGLVDAVIAQQGRLDALVHAAGNQVRQPALDLTVEDWDAVQALHLRTAFLLAQAAARHLGDAGGSIVFVGSLTSDRVGVPGTAPYAAAKSGLLGLMRTLAVEWAPYGIRVNTLAPGFFATRMTEDVADDPRRRQLEARIPLGRRGVPADLAGAAVFLVSDASSYITGHVLTVDGGWTIS